MWATCLSGRLIRPRQETFESSLVWVCPDGHCGDTSKHKQGQLCKICAGEVRNLPFFELGRLFNLKKGVAALEAEEKAKWK